MTVEIFIFDSMNGIWFYRLNIS